MPDWTYREQRAGMIALRSLAVLVRHLGGRWWIPAIFDHPRMPEQWKGRFGVSVPPSVAADAVSVFPVQGAGIVEIGPVGPADVDGVRRAAIGRRCRVTAVAETSDVADALTGYVDAVQVGASADTIRLVSPDLSAAVDALQNPGATVLATPEVLVAGGPNWFTRVIEAGTPTSPPPSPSLRQGWVWASLVGIGLIVAGLGAAAIALGPVLLWYDRDFLSYTVSDLRQLNPHLVGFLQHDRITMAGNMIGLGTLYLCMAQAMRQGFRWARRALAISGLVAFGSYFYFLGTGGFVEPLHTLVVVVLFPMLLVSLIRRPADPHWPAVRDGSESERRHALWGQLLMIGVGGGLSVAGLVISFVGLTSVFVPTDLDFMATHADRLSAANDRLLAFIAHDRAGFGGALIGAGLAVTLISMWGWRRGQPWVWWCLAVGCAFGTIPVLAVHFSIGYTHFIHLLPVYLLVVATITALVLSRNYLTNTEPGPPRT